MVDSFDPATVTGLQYWFDAMDLSTLYQDSSLSTPVTATGQSVGGWKDKSGNARHATQATGTLRLTYRAAYLAGAAKPAIEGDGVDDFLRATGYTTTQPMSLYVVGKIATLGNNHYFSSATTQQVRFYAASSFWRLAAGSGLVSSTINNTNSNYFSGVINGANSAFYRNGSLEASGDAGSNTMDGICIGANGGGGGNFNGGIGEILIYTGAHTTAQRQQIEAYLASRWGI